MPAWGTVAQRDFSLNSGCKGSLPQDLYIWYSEYGSIMLLFYVFFYNHSFSMWISSTSVVLDILNVFLK